MLKANLTVAGLRPAAQCSYGRAGFAFKERKESIERMGSVAEWMGRDVRERAGGCRWRVDRRGRSWGFAVNWGSVSFLCESSLILDS